MPTTPARALPPAQAKALHAATSAFALAAAVKVPFKAVAEQVIRAAASVPANIADGEGRSGQDRVDHWRVAYGSPGSWPSTSRCSPRPAPSIAPPPRACCLSSTRCGR